jgi:hypothetical protein
MKVMMDFMKTMFSLPVPIMLWLGLLTMINIVVPLFFIRTLEGIVTIAAFIAAAITMIMLFHAKGFVRLLGLGQIYWVPLVIWFWTRLELAPPSSLFRYWMWSVIILNTISIAIDTVDIVRYIKGERGYRLREGEDPM